MNEYYKQTYSSSTFAFPKSCEYACALDKPVEKNTAWKVAGLLVVGFSILALFI